MLQKQFYLNKYVQSGFRKWLNCYMHKTLKIVTKSVTFIRFIRFFLLYEIAIFDILLWQSCYYSICEYRKDAIFPLGQMQKNTPELDRIGPFPTEKNSIQADWSIFSNHFSEIFNKNLEKNTTSSKQKWRILKTNKDENKISKKLSGRVETKEIHITQYT